ncbi:MAG: hypothetical protein AABP62_17475 [Planctomycetota bacterium]
MTKSKNNLLSAFLAIVPDTHVSDYAYLNLIDIHIRDIEAQLEELGKRDDPGSHESVFAVWKRLRRYYELRGKYGDGIRFAETFRRAALALHRNSDAAWIRLKDDLWLRVLRGDSVGTLLEPFELTIDEFVELQRNATTDLEQSDCAIGRFTALRYLAGLFRFEPGPVILPRTKRSLTQQSVADWCQDLIEEIRADPHVPRETVLLLEARAEQTLGNIKMSQGHAQQALVHYQRADESFSRYAPADEEHLAIVKCKVAEARLAIAESLFDANRWRGAGRFTREYRGKRRRAVCHQQDAIRLLQQASLFASRIGWAEGEPRISEQLARAFRWEGNLELAVMFADRCVAQYRQLRHTGHIARAALLSQQIKQQLHQDESFLGVIDRCDVIVISRMHGEDDDDKLRIVQQACSAFTVEGEPLAARRVDEMSAGGRITDTLIDTIWRSKIAVAFLDGVRPNVLYELGLVHGRGLPSIICLHATEKSLVPFDIKDFHIVTYESHEELREKLSDQLRSELESMELRFSFSNES